MTAIKAIAGHIVRRGVDAHSSYTHHKHSGGHHHQKPHHDENPFTPLAVATLVLTSIAFVFGLLMVEYTYNNLLPTLAMVETPTALLIESTTTEESSDDKLDKEPLLEQCEVTLVQQTPITASTRKTLKHLRSVGGFFARFRGITFLSAHCLLLSQLTVILQFIPFNFGSIIAATLLSTMRLGWTHVAISSPSPLPWFRRIPSIKNFKAIAPATAFTALCEELSFVAPFGLALALGLPKDLDHQAADKTNMNPQECLMKIIAVYVVFISWVILVVIPVTMALVRMQASLLPESQETIISMQRSGPVSFSEAWKSVDWNARMRVYKVYAKGVAIQLSMLALYGVVIYAELIAFLGPKFPEVITQLMLMV